MTVEGFLEHDLFYFYGKLLLVMFVYWGIKYVGFYCLLLSVFGKELGTLRWVITKKKLKLNLLPYQTLQQPKYSKYSKVLKKASSTKNEVAKERESTKKERHGKSPDWVMSSLFWLYVLLMALKEEQTK